jgi:hypothetical protein
MDEIKNPETPEKLPKTPPPVKTPAASTLSKLVTGKTKISKTTDDDTLIDVHVGNPLRRITELLEDIKKQKAFSFTLKGSLGIMGVVLTFSLLGFFGTTHALCDKGVQTHIGRIKVLGVTETEPDNLVARIQRTITYFSHLFTLPPDTSPRYRYILETPEHMAIHVSRGRDVTLSTFKDKAVYATGLYDSCSQELTVETPDGIEAYNQN